jgi:hypothetical protein
VPVNPVAYGDSLMQRAPEAAIVAKIEVTVGDWRPVRNLCHHNATYFCDNNQEYTPVRGWLYFELPGLEVAKFLSHSVVRASDGTLYDITPWEATQDYGFLAADLSEAEYANLVEEQNHGHLHPRKNAAQLDNRHRPTTAGDGCASNVGGPIVLR